MKWKMIESFYPLHDYVVVDQYDGFFAEVIEVGDNLRSGGISSSSCAISNGDYVLLRQGLITVDIEYGDNDYFLVNYEDILGVVVLKELTELCLTLMESLIGYARKVVGLY